jgi:hypothetical protein
VLIEGTIVLGLGSVEPEEGRMEIGEGLELLVRGTLLVLGGLLETTLKVISLSQELTWYGLRWRI